MQKAIKLVMAGVALAGSAAAADAAVFSPNLVTTSGGSDLELFVTDTANNTFFAQDLGNQLDSFYSKSKVISDGAEAKNTYLTFNTPTSIFGNDASLASFLSTHSADVTAGNVVWTILGGDRSSTAISLGSQRAVLTSSLDLSGVSTNAFTNGNIATFTSNLNTLTNGVNTNYTGSTSSTYGYGSTITGASSAEKLAPTSWVSASFLNGGPIGTAIGAAQTLYLFATNGTGSSASSNVYVAGQITIDALGNIAPVSAVPVPAAIWLFGSGLLGLAGVGRRRGLTSVAA